MKFRNKAQCKRFIKFYAWYLLYQTEIFFDLDDTIIDSPAAEMLLKMKEDFCIRTLMQKVGDKFVGVLATPDALLKWFIEENL